MTKSELQPVRESFWSKVVGLPVINLVIPSVLADVACRADDKRMQAVADHFREFNLPGTVPLTDKQLRAKLGRELHSSGVPQRRINRALSAAYNRNQG